jgi:hypothetical protein
MWICWSVLCFVQVSINRYGKSLWKYHQLIHSCTGFIITVCTGYAAIFIAKKIGGWWFDNLHNASGIITFGLTMLLGIGGISVSMMRFVIKPRWKTGLMLFAAKSHKIFGYFMVLGTQFTLFAGFIRY